MTTDTTMRDWLQGLNADHAESEAAVKAAGEAEGDCSGDFETFEDAKLDAGETARWRLDRLAPVLDALAAFATDGPTAATIEGLAVACGVQDDGGERLHTVTLTGAEMTRVKAAMESELETFTEWVGAEIDEGTPADDADPSDVAEWSRCKVIQAKLNGAMVVSP